jgi:hypothetical protein
MTKVIDYDEADYVLDLFCAERIWNNAYICYCLSQPCLDQGASVGGPPSATLLTVLGSHSLAAP